MTSRSPQCASIICDSALPTIGPRHAIARPGCTRCPIESIGMSKRLSTGTSLLSRASGLASAVPKITCCDGPYISASTRPTFVPRRAKAMARFAVSVDLPTPPLPEPTAISSGALRSAVMTTRTSSTSSRAVRRSVMSRSSAARCSSPSPAASSTSVARPSFSVAPLTRSANSGGRLSVKSLVAMLGAAVASNYRPQPLFFP